MVVGKLLKVRIKAKRQKCLKNNYKQLVKGYTI